ncbi:MAG TPA: hypothetical protein VHC69_35235 [Polyangiaceae bacterium]|nr:hypothetical protein [Polyangiaceae bacterium]
MQVSNLRVLRALFVGVSVSLLASSCSLFVDFDRSKIHENGGKGNGGLTGGGGSPNTNTGGSSTGGSGGSSGSGGSAGAGGSGVVDGGMGGSAESGAGGEAGDSGSGGSGGDAGGSAACDLATHEGCAADELCCNTAKGPACRKTSFDECESCGTPCSATLAKSCTGRTCECDPSSNRPCLGTGAESFCVTVSSQAAQCVECRTFMDCAGRTDGKTECVGNKCVQCDPSKTNAGCSGQTPVCDKTTLSCKPCTATSDCGGTLVCTANGSCGGCRTSAADCATPTTPICDSGTTECRGCSSNTECNTELGLAYCVANSRCSPCDPNTEQGCTDPAKPDCRAAANGNFACQACTTNEHCQSLTATPVCDAGTGKCVECASDDDCTGNAKKPLCVGNVCVACDTPSIVSTADARCAAKPGGMAACAESGSEEGQCTACDPTDSGGCSTDQVCCERSGVPTCVATSATQCTGCGVACNPTLSNTCTDRGCRCGSSAPCSGTGTSRFCTGSPGSCVECLADTDCTDPAAPLCESNQCVACDSAANANTRCQAKQAGACASAGAREGRCSDCDPSDNTGCTGTNQCDPTSAACVDCVNDAACSGKNDKCDTTTNKCVDCTPSGGCSDTPSTPICDMNSCIACQADAECKVFPGTAGPLCGLTGECGPDSSCGSNGDCTDGIHGVCVDVSADSNGDNRCRACNPSTNEGCSSGTCGADYVCSP